MTETVSLQSEGTVDLELMRQPGAGCAAADAVPTREDLCNYVKVPGDRRG
jgi:hypothetical protein